MVTSDRWPDSPGLSADSHRLLDLCGRGHLTGRVWHDVLCDSLPPPLCARSRGVLAQPGSGPSTDGAYRSGA